MYIDENKLQIELLRISKQFDDFKMDPDLAQRIKGYVEDENTLYYPMSGFTKLEIFNTRLYPSDANFYFNDLLLGEFEGIRFRRADVHYIHEYFNDGAIRKDFTEGIQSFDSVLYEFNFDNAFASGLLLKQQDKEKNQFGYISLDEYKGLESFKLFEGLLLKRKDLTTTKVLFNVALLATGHIPSGQGFKLVKNESFDYTQLLTQKVVAKINELERLYKTNIEFSFRANNLYVKIDNQVTFEHQKVIDCKITEEDTFKMKNELKNIIKLAMIFNDDILNNKDIKGVRAND